MKGRSALGRPIVRATHSFPRGFLWGTATSSHQVEGENTNNDWAIWESEPGRILLGHQSGRACEWWNGRWKEDLDRAADSGQNTHRLSLEWSRIEPAPGKWEEAALDAYREIIRGALDRGLMPMVTLHHFTNPIWLADEGGWLSLGVVRLFERYVRKVVEALEDIVGLWVTINEPNVYAYSAYTDGFFPPGEKDLKGAFKVIRHMILAHAAAYHAIHEIQPGSLVGLAHHFRGMQSARPQFPLDSWVARLRSKMFHYLIPRALTDGRIRTPFWRETLRAAAGTQDFLGLNYYTREKVAFDMRVPREAFGRGFFDTSADLSPNGFLANEPSGMWEALQWARGFRLPIYITENGVEDAEDLLRPRYLAAHIRQVWRAAIQNWKVRGYYHWSLVDNFEWERGWTQRFGLWELDLETQERRKRPSADLFSEICHANALSSEMVARYAPEILPLLFPGTAPDSAG